MAPDEAIAEKVRHLIEQLAPSRPTFDVTERTDLREQLGYHSLAVLELAIELEHAFDLDPITDVDVGEILVVGDLVALVRQLVRDGGLL